MQNALNDVDAHGIADLFSKFVFRHFGVEGGGVETLET